MKIKTMLIQSPTIKEGKSSIYFWKQKINWAFMPKTDLGWILRNSMQIVLNE